MTPPAEQQPLSRRQLRELQRTGQIPTSPAADAPDAASVPDAGSTESERPLSDQPVNGAGGDVADDSASDAEQAETPYAKVAPTDEVIETAEIVSPLSAPTTQDSDVIVPVIPSDGVPLTRRQARELERARTASITVVPADAGAAPQETGEIVTAEPIDSTGEHAPVTEERPDTELEVVERNASETGDLTEVVIDAEPTADESDSSDHAQPVTVADGFGEAALTTDADPLSEEKAFDTLIATGIADADADAESDRTPTTSSTLILGSPMATFTGPIGGTGEIMVTGSIDLPRTMSGTADPDTQDRADYDRSLDHEPPAPPTAGTPVSASRAVSTHTSARDIIAPPARSKKPSIVPILAITAGVLMVAVIAVIVTSLLTGAL